MNVAIIGSGISGLGLVYLLNKHHNLVLYEKNNYLGGHSRTITINVNKKNIVLDTGFIVFNNKNYPYLSKLFNELNIDTLQSNMSFGVSINDGELEYGMSNLSSIFAQKKNIVSLDFWQMLADILKFNHNAKKYIDSDLTLKELIDRLNLGRWFQNYYLLAMGGSIWSTVADDMLNFPARTFIRFFTNHGLLTINKQPDWLTIKGGSKEYVNKIIDNSKVTVKLNTEVLSVVRDNNTISVIDNNGKVFYDKVIFACHSDEVIKILQQPTTAELNCIGAINYQKNEIVVHSDISFMQRNKKTWSSWVYLSNNKSYNKKLSLSYWMNNLQKLDTTEPIIITLNPVRQPENIYDKHIFYHPVFDQKAIKAQSKLASIQGDNNTYFAGAWQQYGFHEDGLLSAVRVADKMGIIWD